MDVAMNSLIRDTAAIIDGALSVLMDNNRPARDRADAALTIFHGVATIAIANGEPDYEWIASVRERMKAAEFSIDLAESKLRTRRMH